MKKLSLSLLVFFFLASTITKINAQDDHIFGLKGGINFGNLTNEDGNNKLAFHGGGYMQFMYNETFGLQPELVISIKGHGENDFGRRLNMTYIDIPVLFKYNIRYNYNVMIGPYGSILVNATAKDAMFSEDVTGSRKTTDFGLAIGGGLYFLDKYHAYIRYLHGFTNTSEFSSPGFEQRHRIFQAGLGINLFRIEQ